MVLSTVKAKKNGLPPEFPHHHHTAILFQLNKDKVVACLNFPPKTLFLKLKDPSASSS